MSRVEYWFTKLGNSLREFYGKCGPCHDLGHVLRVAALAERIAEEEEVAVDLAVLAALFHDAGHADAATAGTNDHELRSAQLAEQALRELLAPSDLTEVVNAITTRRFAKREQTWRPIGTVLEDADNLDAIGLLGVSRAFLWLGEHGWPTEQTRALPSTNDLVGRNYVALRQHWEAKLAHLAGGMRTATGRRLADPRHRSMLAFLDALRRELDGPLDTGAERRSQP